LLPALQPDLLSACHSIGRCCPPGSLPACQPAWPHSTPPVALFAANCHTRCVVCSKQPTSSSGVHPLHPPAPLTSLPPAWQAIAIAMGTFNSAYEGRLLYITYFANRPGSFFGVSWALPARWLSGWLTRRLAGMLSQPANNKAPAPGSARRPARGARMRGSCECSAHKAQHLPPRSAASPAPAADEPQV